MFDNNVQYEITLTNNSGVDYREWQTGSSVAIGQTIVITITGENLANTIMSNVAQHNALRGRTEIVANAVALGGSSGGGTASYPSFTGNADKVLAVNATEDGVEWTAAVTQVYVDTQDNLIINSLTLKADTNYVDTQNTLLQDQIDLKANTTDVNQSLVLKADANYVDTQDSLLQDQIDLKANTTDVNQSLVLKADANYVDTQDSLLQDQIDLKANTTDVNQSLVLKADAMATSQSLALKADLIGGLIPASQLPSYVDDVLNFPDLASFPSLGEVGKIYIAEDVNKTYRWSGSSYVEISGGGVALGETSSTAYRGDNGKIAYDHSLSQGNPHNATTSDINEGTNLFFTESRVNQTVLTGLNTSTATPALATDQLLAAIGKLQAQINNVGGDSSVTWVDAASIGTIHPAFSTVQFAKINGLLWMRGYCSHLAAIPTGTTLFLLTDPSYHLDIPTTSTLSSRLGETRVFNRDTGGAKFIQLKNVVNNANKFSLLNSPNFTANEYNQIELVALGSLLTP
jgi:hypothetical protein